MNISSFSPFCWVNPLFQLHFSCIHYTGACTSHRHKVKSTFTSGPSDVMMSEVLCIEVMQVFFLSISAAPSTEQKLRCVVMGQVSLDFTLLEKSE